MSYTNYVILIFDQESEDEYPIAAMIKDDHIGYYHSDNQSIAGTLADIQWTFDHPDEFKDYIYDYLGEINQFEYGFILYTNDSTAATAYLSGLEGTASLPAILDMQTPLLDLCTPSTIREQRDKWKEFWKE